MGLPLSGEGSLGWEVVTAEKDQCSASEHEPGTAQAMDWQPDPGAIVRWEESSPGRSPGISFNSAAIESPRKF